MRLPFFLLFLPLAAQAPREVKLPFYGRELVYRVFEPPAPGPTPLLVAADESWDLWMRVAGVRGWRLVAPANLAPAASDPYAKALEVIVADALKRMPVDPARVYLVGAGRGVAPVFYARGRVPHLWAAAFAALGDPKPAIDSNRLFAANPGLVPLLWAARPEDALIRQKLQAADYPFEWRDANQLKAGEETAFLAANARPAHPAQIDCETGNLGFARCYWLEITKPDPARRNDVLRPSRVTPGSGAYLDLGGFGYDSAAVVAWLPEGYKGKLKLGDRIVSVGGTKIADGAAYARLMEETREQKPVGLVVERGKERIRIETRVLLPKREETVTARLRAEWSQENRELLIVSRGVAGMKLDLPQAWSPAAINWNGREILKADAPGCWIISDTPHRCPAP